MSIGLILLSLAVLFLGMSGWLWLCAGFRRGGLRGALGLAAVQVSGLCLACGILRGQPLAGLYTAAFPPLAAVQLVALAQPPGLLAALLWRGLPYAAAVLVAGLAVRRLRVWTPLLAGLALMIAAALSGDQVSKEAMCRAAAARGIHQFQRNSFASSLTAGPGTQGAVHALATAGERRLRWSYRLMDWYPLPDGVPVAIPETSVVCAP